MSGCGLEERCLAGSELLAATTVAIPIDAMDTRAMITESRLRIRFPLCLSGSGDEASG
jgi:hypothetical protein